MYLECKKCSSPEIELTGPYDNFPFFCTECNEFLRFEDVKEYKSLSNNYTSKSFTQLLVLKDK